jgi:hypothetical protein
VLVFQIPQVQFAVAEDSNYTFSGILGLGYAYPYSIKYPSVLNLMVSQKMILAPIFSLGLGGDQDNFSKCLPGPPGVVLSGLLTVMQARSSLVASTGGSLPVH